MFDVSIFIPRKKGFGVTRFEAGTHQLLLTQPTRSAFPPLFTNHGLYELSTSYTA